MGGYLTCKIMICSQEPWEMKEGGSHLSTSSLEQRAGLNGAFKKNSKCILVLS